jgi:hypothetical protein
MKHAAFLLGVVFLFAASAGAQSNSEAPPPSTSSASSVTLPALTPAASPMFALATPPSTSAFALPDTNPLGANPQDNGASAPVYGVFRNYSWQATAGYTFYRFYIVPHPSTVVNLNGFDLGIVYYPKAKWFGVEGDFVGVWGGSPFGYTSKFTLADGGGRFRWAGPRGIEIWGHALVGGAHYLPQTAYGSQSALVYEVGGGVDIGKRGGRFAYRAQADMVGTRFFSTYQYSPRVSIGVVYRY